MKNPIKVLSSDGSYTQSQSISTARVSASNTIYVDNVYGNDTTGDGSSTKPYKTILKGFQNKPTDPQWAVTNPAYRVNFSTGNDGTGGRFGGKFATIAGAMNHGSYTQGDTIYIEAGSTSGSFTFGGRDFFFEDGVSITQTSASHCWVSSSYTNRDYAVAGNLAMTLTNSTGLVVYHDTDYKGYFQFKSLTLPASYSSTIFRGESSTAAGNMYVWLRSDLDRSGGTQNTGEIIHAAAADCEIRAKNILTNGGLVLRTTGAGALRAYLGSITSTGGANCIDTTTGDILAVVRGSISCAGKTIVGSSTANVTIYTDGNITSTANHAISSEGTGITTIVCGGTISTEASSYYAVLASVANSKVDVTAKRIQRSDTSTSTVYAQSSTASVKLRNADIRGSDNSARGPILTTTGATIEIYDCILRSAAASPQPTIREASSGAGTVSWFGTCRISDAVHVSITETNPSNRTVDSTLRY